MKCRVCGGRRQNAIFQKGLYSIYRCHVCGFGTLSPLPSDRELCELYCSEKYHDDKSSYDHAADAKKKLDYVARCIRQHNGALSQMTLLDYGCGTGDVLKTAKAMGFQPYGYEISNTAAVAAQNKSKCEVNCAPLSAAVFKTHSFDVITSFDVIEHVIDFERTISYWKRWLKPTGYLFLTTPDLSSWDRKLFGTRWYGYTKIPQHLNYFDRSSMKMVLNSLGFMPLNLQTWGFSRTLSFIAKKLPGSTLSQCFIDLLGLGSRTIYTPMIDLMVVAVPISHG